MIANAAGKLHLDKPLFFGVIMRNWQWWVCTYVLSFLPGLVEANGRNERFVAGPILAIGRCAPENGIVGMGFIRFYEINTCASVCQGAGHRFYF